MSTQRKRVGFKSTKYGHLGVYILSSGPDPNGPAPGERVILVIYDKGDNIIRKLEQIKGDCINDGYIDFFNSLNCRPSVDEFHIIDIDRNGNPQILATHTTPSEARSWLIANVSNWANQHGIMQ